MPAFLRLLVYIRSSINKEKTQMKLNWKTFKITFALIIVIGSIFWAGSSLRTQFYSGSNLNFVVGNGTVSVTNPSNQIVSVQLLATGSRSFTVSSPIRFIPTSSTKLGTGRDTTQTVEFELLPGVTEFTVVRRTSTTPNVTFVTNSAIDLEANAQPLNTSDSRATLFVVVVIILGALFYISNITEHRWINVLRGKNASNEETRPNPVISDIGQGDALRPYGDNRASILS
jgi:hypothetical protein